MDFDPVWSPSGHWNDSLCQIFLQTVPTTVADVFGSSDRSETRGADQQIRASMAWGPVGWSRWKHRRAGTTAKGVVMPNQFVWVRWNMNTSWWHFLPEHRQQQHQPQLQSHQCRSPRRRVYPVQFFFVFFVVFLSCIASSSAKAGKSDYRPCCRSKTWQQCCWPVFFRNRWGGRRADGYRRQASVIPRWNCDGDSRMPIWFSHWVGWRPPLETNVSHKVLSYRWVDMPHRSRYIVRGYVQELTGSEDLNVPTPLSCFVQTLFVCAEREGHTVRLEDCTIAYLQSNLVEEIYFEPPAETQEPADVVWRLHKAFPGLKKGTVAWKTRIDGILGSLPLNFKLSRVDSRNSWQIHTMWNIP